MSAYNKWLPVFSIGLKKFVKHFYYLSVFDIPRRFIHLIIIKIRFNNKFIDRNESFLRLHLGCGNVRFPGYINIDFRKTKGTDYVCNAVKLPFPDNSVEVIETYHMIEHLPKKIFERTLKCWWKKLIPRGKLIIECPDFDMSVKEYLKGNEERLYNIFGLNRYKGDFISILV